SIMDTLSSSASCPEVYNRSGGSIILQHYNYTGRLQHRTSGKSSIGTGSAVLLCFSILIMLENLLVLMAVLFRVRMRHRWLYICIGNIALSDLITGAAYVVNICMSGGLTMQLSPLLWLVREGLLFVALSASVFSLLLIALERYATMKSESENRYKKTYRIYILVVLCWILAFIIGFLPLFGWNCVCDLSGCSTLLPLYSKSYILFALVIFFIILLSICGLYFAIYWRVRKNTSTALVKSRKRSIRLLKAVISIVAAFVLCWGPLFVLLLIDYYCYSRLCESLFSPQWVIALAVLNSAINPLIYSMGSQDLRKAICSLLCCICRPESFSSKETSSTSVSRHSSLRNSFNKVRNLSTSPQSQERSSKKTRLSSTTSCLSASSS
ncbi:sphingosine 1-phosphate receptor 4, partial [Silurus asotus]